jgi:REP element-mobilizing transposase RayT
MARPLRVELAGGLYHVTSRGDRREAIYHDDADRTAWLDLMGEVCQRFNWRCHAYCQMTNHYHVVVETPEANLSKGMRQLNGVYTQSTNRRHGLVGQASAPAWLDTDWLRAQFGEERAGAQAGYADFVRQGIGGTSIWEGLRHQVLLGSEGFAERHCATTKPLEQVREVPRAQR